MDTSGHDEVYRILILLKRPIWLQVIRSFGMHRRFENTERLNRKLPQWHLMVIRAIDIDQASDDWRRRRVIGVIHGHQER